MSTPRVDLSFQSFQMYPEWWYRQLEIETMSAEAEGTLLRLLMRQWVSVTLPADPTQLMRLTKIRTEKEWGAVWAEIEPLLPLVDGGAGRRNPTWQQLREERAEFIEKKRTAGKSGGRPKKVRATKAEADENHADNQQDEQRESTQKADGFGLLNHMGKQTESPMSMSMSTTLPPPPGGGVVLPTPPLQLESSGSSIEQRATVFNAALDDAVAAVPHDEARAAMRRLLDYTRAKPANWQSLVARMVNWTKGLSTSGMRKVSFEAIAEGIGELLDNDKGAQPITPQVVLIFAEKAEARRKAGAPLERKERGASGLSSADGAAIRSARNGDADAIAYCTEHGLNYEAVA